MKVMIAGATGLIGKKLVKGLIERGDSVFVIGRSVDKIKSIWGEKVLAIEWNPRNPESGSNKNLSAALGEVDGVINLAGENVGGKRWSAAFKKIILESRIQSTNLLVRFITENKIKPRVYVGASAIGYYGAKREGEITEESEPGTDFMAMVTKEWEAASAKLNEENIRRVVLRFGVVLSKEEGALKKMLLPFKMFVGGPLGTGRQWFPWVHIDDVVSAILFSLDREVAGSFNVVSPEIATMNEFCEGLGKVMKRPSFFKVPGFVLKIVLGEFADYVLNGAKIKPARLEEAGFEFKYTQLSEALKNLLRTVRG